MCPLPVGLELITSCELNLSRGHYATQHHPNTNLQPPPLPTRLLDMNSVSQDRSSISSPRSNKKQGNDANLEHCFGMEWKGENLSVRLGLSTRLAKSKKKIWILESFGFWIFCHKTSNRNIYDVPLKYNILKGMHYEKKIVPVPLNVHSFALIG